MTRMKCCVCEIYHNLLDVPKQPTCMNGGYRELYQQLQSPSGRARANGTRASAHVTFQFVNNNKQPLAINLFMAICIYLACTRFSDKCHYGVA